MEQQAQKTQQIIEKLSQASENNNFVPSSKKRDEQNHQKSVFAWKLVGKILLFIWTILVFVRVPFIGSYIDGLFDYLIGFAKYFVYVLICFVIIGWIFETGYTRVIKTKRFLIFSLIALLSACCVISGITGMIDSFNKPVTFNAMVKNYHNAWLPYFKNWHYSGFFNHYVTGGILAELISYAFAFLSFIVLIVVAGIILLISIFLIFNINYRSTRIGLKLRGWMIRKLGGTFKYDGYNELKVHRDNQNKFKKTKKFDIEKIALENSSIPFNLLPDTDLNKFNLNFKQARRLQNKLATLFRNHKIDCVPTDINVYTGYSEVCFEAKSKAEVQAILQLQPRIAKTMKLDHFNISIRGNILNIEIENMFFSKISLKTCFNLYDKGKDMTSIIGLDKNSDLFYQDFKNVGSSLIIGKKGSGASTLAVLMALSMCYITSPDDLNLVILNPNYEATYSAFNDIPHMQNQKYETINECTEKLHDLQNIVNDRASLLKVNGVGNIDQYNKSTTLSKWDNILVVIGNVDVILKDTFQNNKIISDLLINGPKVGIYLVMQSYLVNNDIIDPIIYDNVQQKYILSLNTKEESMKIFNNSRGYQLHNNGDCITFVNNKLTYMKRLQICNINYAELTADLGIIKTFYATKLKQREAQILMEAKNEENGK